MNIVPRPNSFASYRFLLFIVGVFIVAAAAVAVPVFSGRSGSSSIEPSQDSKSLAARRSQFNPLTAARSSRLSSLSANLLPVQETIATFAADCVTPKTAFLLGETVCAQTDNVDLNYPGGRWVHWLRPNLSIASGGSGTTTIVTNPQTFSFIPDVTGTWKASIAETGDISQTPAIFTVLTQADPIATYTADCGTPKTTFNLGEVVCARATSFSGFRFGWVDPDGFIERTAPITSNPQTDLFTTPSDPTGLIQGVFVVQNVGTWRVNVITSRNSVRASAFYTVKDPGHNTADLSAFISALTSNPAAGGPVQYQVTVTNKGPGAAANVHLIDDTFANATVASVSQTSGLANTFNCPVGSTVDCSITSFPAGAEAQFLITLTAGAAGSTIDNRVRVTSTTDLLNPGDDEALAQPVKVGTGAGSTACVLECPNNMTVSANTTQAGQPGTFVTFPNAEKFGTCGAVTMSPASGTFFEVGQHTVTASAPTDGTCTFTITVVQSAAPTIICEPDQTATASGSQGEVAVAVAQPTATGNNFIVVGNRNDNRSVNDPYPVGVTTITWTVKECNDPPLCDDPNIRTASCTQHVTVTSADAPTIACPNAVTFNGTGCEKTLTPADLPAPPATGLHVTVTGRRGDNLALYADPYPAGQTIITWTATECSDYPACLDPEARSVSCTQIVTINSSGSDTTAPTLVVPDNVSVETSSCSELLDDELGVATAEDSCSSVSIARTGVPRFACPTPSEPLRTCESFVFPTGTTVVTYTATDASGNTATGQQLVTVHESTPPTITAPGDRTVDTLVTDTGCGTLVSDAILGSATANDNCPGVTIARTGVPAGNIFPVGDTYITYVATDRSGNANTTPAVQKVTVVDKTPPVFTSVPPTVVAYTGAGATSCDTMVDNLTIGTAAATDNCGTVNVTRSPSGNTFPVGNTTITWTATDDANPANTTTATQTITVIDNTVPVITVNGSMPSMWPPNHKYQTFQLTGFVTGASDNCGGVGVSNVVIEKVTSDETENGNGDGNTTNDIIIAADCKSVQLRAERDGGGNGRVYTITFKVTDTHGNVGRATSKVVVQHNPGEAVVDSGVHYTVNGTCP